MYERAYEEQALTMWKEEHTGEEVQEKFEMMRRKAGDPAEWKVQDGWTTDGQHANVAAPVSVQIVGRPGTEELLCDFAQLIRRLEL